MTPRPRSTTSVSAGPGSDPWAWPGTSLSAVVVRVLSHASRRDGHALGQTPARGHRGQWRCARERDRRHRPGRQAGRRGEALRARHGRQRRPSRLRAARRPRARHARRARHRLDRRRLLGADRRPRGAPRARRPRAAARPHGGRLRLRGGRRGADRAGRSRSAPGDRGGEPGRAHARRARAHRGLAGPGRRRRGSGRRRRRDHGPRRRGPPHRRRSAPAPATSGSWRARRRAATVLAELRARGLDEESVLRVRAPAGLDLGPSSQEEIAVAILAELVAWRHTRAARAPCRPRPRPSTRSAA